MKIIDAYDLVSLLSSMKTLPSSLTAKKINLITKRLAENGIESQFFLSSFEAIQIEHPGCISVSRTEISIASPDKLNRISPKQIDNHIKQLIKTIINDGREI